MTATLAPAAPQTQSTTSVPMLDVSRENDRLRDELDAAIAEVCRSARLSTVRLAPSSKRRSLNTAAPSTPSVARPAATRCSWR